MVSTVDRTAYYIPFIQHASRLLLDPMVGKVLSFGEPSLWDASIPDFRHTSLNRQPLLHTGLSSFWNAGTLFTVGSIVRVNSSDIPVIGRIETLEWKRDEKAIESWQHPRLQTQLWAVLSMFKATDRSVVPTIPCTATLYETTKQQAVLATSIVQKLSVCDHVDEWRAGSWYIAGTVAGSGKTEPYQHRRTLLTLSTPTADTTIVWWRLCTDSFQPHSTRNKSTMAIYIQCLNLPFREYSYLENVKLITFGPGGAKLSDLLRPLLFPAQWDPKLGIHVT